MENIEKKIKEIIRDQLELAELPENDTSLFDLGLDSLESAELLMSVEDTFEISIPDIDMTALGTVEDIINTVREHL